MDGLALALRQRFFDAWMTQNPEDASSLGLPGFAHRLGDRSPAGVEAEQRLHQDTLAELATLDRTALDPDLALDLLMVERLSRFRLRESDMHLARLEPAMTPHFAMVMQRAQAKSDQDLEAFEARAAAVPDYLEGVTACLREGLRAGRTCDATVAHALASHDMPAAAAFYEAHGSPEGAAAYRRLAAFVMEELLPVAVDSPHPGPEAYRVRLREDMGLKDTAEQLVERARELLADTEAEAYAVASRMTGRRVGDMDTVRMLVREAEKELPAADSDVAPLYRGLLDETVAFCAEHALLDVPDGADLDIVAELSGKHFPYGGATNWPAPLKDPTGRGLFVVVPDRTMHPLIHAPMLAIHEAIPGHFMQSVWWQQRFADDPAPVRFLLTSDGSASCSDWWPQMLNIEGWATYAEELMRTAGFYERRDAAHLFALVCKAVRAVRVVVDVSLHTGAMTPEACGRFFIDHTSFGEARANRELIRYRRIPGQAITYLLGRLQIEDLAARWRDKRAPGEPISRFHDTLFAAGPVPPSLLAESLGLAD